MSDDSLIYMAEPPEGEVHSAVNPPTIGPGAIAMGSVLTAIACIVVGLRIFTVLSIVGRRMGIDDYLVIVSLAFSILLMGLFPKLVEYGLGNHMWDVLYTDYSPHVLVYTLCSTIAYSLSISFSKLSILVFYLRLSPQQHFRFTVWALIGVVICYSIAYVFLSLFGCSPVKGSWDLEVMATAKCVDKLTSYMVLSIANIVIDIATLALPMPVLIPLQMPRRQKISLFLLFTTGAVVCAIAIRRTLLLPGLLSSTDYTWDAIEQFYWCFAEVNGGVLCASVPALKPFFVRYLPRLLNSSLRTGSNGTKGIDSNATKAGLSTTVDRNRERRQIQEESYELGSQEDLSWENGYHRNKKPDDDEAKLWTGTLYPKNHQNKTTTVIVGNAYEGDSSSVDADQSNGHQESNNPGNVAHITPRNSPPSRGINVTSETRVEYG